MSISKSEVSNSTVLKPKTKTTLKPVSASKIVNKTVVASQPTSQVKPSEKLTNKTVLGNRPKTMRAPTPMNKNTLSNNLQHIDLTANEQKVYREVQSRNINVSFMINKQPEEICSEFMSMCKKKKITVKSND